jgi:hypothetical protein
MTTTFVDPDLAELAAELNSITQTDLKVATTDPVPLGEDEELLGLTLGGTLDDLTKAARAQVLLHRFGKEIKAIAKGKTNPPKGFTEGEWIGELETKIHIYIWFADLFIRRMAHAKGIEIPDEMQINIIFLDGQFQATLRPRDDEDDDLDPDVDVDFESDLDESDPTTRAEGPEEGMQPAVTMPNVSTTRH